jgi:hypothetical protein
MSKTSLTGQWTGHYVQRDRRHAIAARLVQANECLTGSMCDEDTDSERSVFEVACEAGLPPGADEQIIARLRELFPDAPATPIRYVTHLPKDSILEGWVRGRNVYFKKTYQGTHFGGYKVGDKVVGDENPGHAVHYQGQVSVDGSGIEGKWWIDPVGAAHRTEGTFALRRQAEMSTAIEEQRAAADWA